MVHQRCVEAGTIAGFAQAAGLDRCVVTNERVGKRLVSRSTAHALGLRRVVAYVRD